MAGLTKLVIQHECLPHELSAALRYFRAAPWHFTQLWYGNQLLATRSAASVSVVYGMADLIARPWGNSWDAKTNLPKITEA